MRFAIGSPTMGLFVMLLATASPAVEVGGILAVADGGTGSYLAVRLDLADGEAVSRIHWVNNDETTPPSVYVVPASAEGFPDLSGARVQIHEPVWSSLEWITGELTTPVFSHSGVVFAVFEFPPNNVMSGKGLGRGAGVAYKQGSSQLRTLISVDGQSWDTVWDELSVEFGATMASSAGAQLLAGASKANTAAPSNSDGSDAAASTRVTRLQPPSPNPFNPSTMIGFELVEPGPIELAIYNLRGQRICVLRQGHYATGAYRVRWEGTDDAGRRVASGLYLVRFSTSAVVESKRLVLAK